MTTTTEIDTFSVKRSLNPLICINNAVVAYQNVVALANINLDVYEGDILGICGPNGSGKSTLLKAILNLVPLSYGTIRFHSQDSQVQLGEEYRQDINIGYVPQIHNIDRNFPALVEDVVAMGRYAQVGFLKRVKKSDPYIENALRSVGMWKFRKRPIGHLSGGQQQKVMIARSLASNPKILLLDEPTAALDFRIERAIMDLIQQLHQKQNLTIILVTHRMSFLKDFTTRVVCLDKSIIWEGEPSDPKLQAIINQLFFQ
ncbi:MAG: metal ABC transporter ATP-binding protein [Promethearchaeota archaeon]